MNARPIIDYFGREVAICLPRSRRRLETKAFQYWREAGFPYPDLPDTAFESEWKSLERITKIDLRRLLMAPSYVGLRIANYFQPNIWHAKSRGRSPYESFNHDTSLWRVITRSPELWLDRRCWNGRSIRQQIGLANRARVSNFRPTVAASLVAAYSPPSGRVLDFCGGYGGRLLGALAMGRDILVIDVERENIRGMERMRHYIGARSPSLVTCIAARAEEELFNLERRCFDLILTSPPYYNTEKYSQSNEQSFVRYKLYSQWKEEFLRPCLHNSFHLLRRGGFLILNIANTLQWKLADDTKTEALRQGFCKHAVFYMGMKNNPNAYSRTGHFLRQEPVMVFRKP